MTGVATPIDVPMGIAPRSEFSFWLRAFGILASTLSIISLIQKTFSIGLAPVLAELLAFYRKLAHPPLDFVFSFIHWSPPFWYKDLFVLSFVGILAMLRASVAALAEQPNWRPTVATFAGSVAIAIVASIPLFGLFMMLACLAFPVEMLRKHIDKHGAERGYEVGLFPAARDAKSSLVIMLAAAGAFFATNAML